MVVEEMVGDQVTYIDPADGRHYTVERATLERAWQLAGGEAILIAPAGESIEV
ncbi:MAG: hypothetical protein ACE5NP_05180 [Anaerolineae bacterium]